MSKERQHPSLEGFGFSESEKLWDRVSDERFREMIFDPQTTVHRVTIDSNNYGEFLFLTASRSISKGRECITYWGYGLQEYREKWLTQQWFWYRTSTARLKCFRSGYFGRMGAPSSLTSKGAGNATRTTD